MIWVLMPKLMHSWVWSLTGVHSLCQYYWDDMMSNCCWILTIWALQWSERVRQAVTMRLQALCRVSSTRVVDFAGFVFGNEILKIKSLSWGSTVTRDAFWGCSAGLLGSRVGGSLSAIPQRVPQEYTWCIMGFDLRNTSSPQL